MIQQAHYNMCIQKKGNQYVKEICTYVHSYVHCSIFHDSQLKCSPADIWVKKRWYMHIVEHHSAFKEKEISSYATT